MLEISRFYGIVIKIFYKLKEYEPCHIHVIYGEYVGLFDLESLKMVEGDLPNKAQELVREWLIDHQLELINMWDKQEITKLPPTIIGVAMIPRIKTIETQLDYKLKVVFDDGKIVIYDMKEDIEILPEYNVLNSVPGMFEQVRLDDSRTIVYWNDEIDLPSDMIYEYGQDNI